MSPAPPVAATRGFGGDPRAWTEGQLSEWLLQRGLPEEIARAFEAHLVNGLLGVDLSQEDLGSMGITDALHQRRVALELHSLFEMAEHVAKAEQVAKADAPCEATPAPRTPARRPTGRPHSARRPSPYLQTLPSCRRSRPRSARSPSLAHHVKAPPEQRQLPCDQRGAPCGPLAAPQLEQDARTWQAEQPPGQGPTHTSTTPLPPAPRTPQLRPLQLAQRCPSTALPCVHGAVPAPCRSDGDELAEALQERDSLREELRAALRGFEAKALSYSSALQAAVSECEALRSELRAAQRRCEAQERQLQEALQAKDAAEEACRQTVAAPEALRRRRGAEVALRQELSIATWRAEEFERRWLAAETELGSTRRALQQHLASEELALAECPVGVCLGAPAGAPSARPGAPDPSPAPSARPPPGDLGPAPEQLDDLCEEFRLQVRDMITAAPARALAAMPSCSSVSVAGAAVPSVSQVSGAGRSNQFSVVLGEEGSEDLGNHLAVQAAVRSMFAAVVLDAPCDADGSDAG